MMKSHKVKFAILFLLLLGAKPVATLADTNHWHKSVQGVITGAQALEAAKIEARAAGKYVFLVVGNYKCMGCDSLKDELCEDPAIRALLDPYYVCCYLYAYDDTNWPLALSYNNVLKLGSYFPWAWIVDPNETEPAPLAGKNNFYGTGQLKVLLNDNKPTLPPHIDADSEGLTEEQEVDHVSVPQCE